MPFDSVKRLKKSEGEFLRCRDCQTVWFTHPNDRAATIITSQQLDSALYWDQTDLSIDSSFIPILKEIGATPYLMKGEHSEKHVCIPCKCTLIDGRILDHCVISAQNAPPIYPRESDNTVFVDQVTKIEISEFALPFEIRLETTCTGYDEQVDEYHPTIIETPDKHLFYLDYGVNFFYENGTKGKEITEMSYSEEQLRRTPKEMSNRIKETYIIADWTKDFAQPHNNNEYV